MLFRSPAFRVSPGWVRWAYPALLLLVGGAITASLSAQPRYIIEYLGVGTQPFRTGGAKNPQGTTSRVGEHHVYRITARSQGGTDGVVHWWNGSTWTRLDTGDVTRILDGEQGWRQERWHLRRPRRSATGALRKRR